MLVWEQAEMATDEGVLPASKEKRSISVSYYKLVIVVVESSVRSRITISRVDCIDPVDL